MTELKEFKCGCCGITYEIELDRYEMPPLGCDGCRHHLDARTVEELLRQRADHGRLWTAHLDYMFDRIEAAEARTRSVYHTRGLALGLLNSINLVHYMRPDGRCSCNLKACRVGPMIARNRLLERVIKSYDDREQKRLREIQDRQGFDDAADEWDEFIDANMVNPPQATAEPAAEDVG